LIASREQRGNRPKSLEEEEEEEEEDSRGKACGCEDGALGERERSRGPRRHDVIKEGRRDSSTSDEKEVPRNVDETLAVRSVNTFLLLLEEEKMLWK